VKKWLFLLLFTQQLNAQNLSYTSVSLGKYQATIFDENMKPAGVDFFPEKRFTPTKEDVVFFEENFKDKLEVALLQQHNIYFKNLPYQQDFTDNEIQNRAWLLSFKDDAEKYSKKRSRKIKRHSKRFNRNYYGYINESGQEVVHVEFIPLREQWIRPYQSQKDILYSLPKMEFNNITKAIQIAGYDANLLSINREN